MSTFKFLGEPFVSRWMGRPLGSIQQSPGALLPYEVDFSTLGDGVLPDRFTAPNWAVSSGAAVGTPTGTSRLTNGDFESWSSPTDADNWIETIAGGSTVNRDGVEQRSGTYCCRLDIDAGNNNAEINQIPTVALGGWLSTGWWLKSSAASGKSALILHKNQYPENYAVYLTNSYQNFTQSSVKRLAAGFGVGVRKLSAASSSIYIDDVVTTEHNTSSLVATVEAGASDVTVKAGWTLPGNPDSPLAGVIMNADSATNPVNYVVFLVNGDRNNSYLFKIVGTTVTQVATTAITYADGANVELRKSGTTYQMYYNGAQVGANQTISDSELVDNTIHGMFSTSANSSCDYFFAE